MTLTIQGEEVLYKEIYVGDNYRPHHAGKMKFATQGLKKLSENERIWLT